MTSLGYNNAIPDSNAGTASDGYRYAGHTFAGHVPIWVRQPNGIDYCPWTQLKHTSFTNWVVDHREQLITYKLNPKTSAGTQLIWLPSLMESLKGNEKEILGPYADHSSLKSRCFPCPPPIAVRFPARKQTCPWTSLSASSLRTIRKRHFPLSLGGRPIPIRDLYQAMMSQADMPDDIRTLF